jgi:suppressor for copper-sensitivity B
VFALAALLLLIAGAPQARAAAASPWFVTDQGRVRLIAARAYVGDDKDLRLGLDFELAPGWKIYWRSPGEAGYPPRLDWTGSQGLDHAAILWPAPMRFTVLGLETIGYEGHVVLPIEAMVQPGAPAQLHAALDYLTCSKICVPHETVLALDLPATTEPGGFGPLIAQYAAHVPHDGAGEGLAIASAKLRPGNPAMLDVAVKTDRPLGHPDAFVEGAADLAFGAPETRAAAPDETLLRLPAWGNPDAVAAIVGKPLAVTLVDGDRAITATVTPALGAPAVDWSRLAPILAIALLGGLILNVMPCVLPVLSLKLLGVIAAGRDARAVRMGFLATSAGILLSFAALAAAMIVLREAGIAVGWGMQFQSPVFLAFMAMIVALFAANLLGLFEVRLPGALLYWVAGRRLGNVATGAFATLLATPCSAPFLGTAIGFALASGPIEILAVFLALGVGFAAPYLLVAALPRVARLMPRPGRWMVFVRKALGLALAATAVWLVAVLADRGSAAPADEAGLWHPFDPGSLGPLVHDGKVVFVDVTADWCLTCKVNERLVLDDPSVRTSLEAGGVVAMRADWTHPDAAIADYLKRFGRYGIPFNAVYGPGAPAGVALPEILTAATVRAALDRAAGPRG